MIDKEHKLEIPAALNCPLSSHFPKQSVNDMFERVTQSHQCLLATQVRLRVVSRVYCCTICILKMTVGVFIHLPRLWGFLMKQPCSVFWVVLPRTSHIFFQWYVSPVGAILTFWISMFPKRNNCALTCFVMEPVDWVESFKYLAVVLDTTFFIAKEISAATARSSKRWLKTFSASLP